MTKEEIALQLTLKAMECDRIGQHKPTNLQIDQPDKAGCYNMKLVCDVFNAALENLKLE